MENSTGTELYNVDIEGPCLAYRGHQVLVTGYRPSDCHVRIYPVALVNLAKVPEDSGKHAIMSMIALTIRDDIGFWGRDLWVPASALQENEQ